MCLGEILLSARLQRSHPLGRGSHPWGALQVGVWISWVETLPKISGWLAFRMPWGRARPLVSSLPALPFPLRPSLLSLPPSLPSFGLHTEGGDLLLSWPVHITSTP